MTSIILGEGIEALFFLSLWSIKSLKMLSFNNTKVSFSGVEALQWNKNERKKLIQGSQ